MELHSRVYYKHSDSTIMGQLEVLFTTHHGDEEKFIQTALLINPQAGEITQELVDLITAQRNFQANAKAIETSSTMTSAIINIRA